MIEAAQAAPPPPSAAVANRTAPVSCGTARETRPLLTLALFVLVAITPVYLYLGHFPQPGEPEQGAVELGDVMILSAPKAMETQQEVHDSEPFMTLGPEVDEDGQDVKAALLPDIIPLDEGQP